MDRPQQQLDILVPVKAVDAVERVTARDGIEYHGQGQSPGVDRHPGGHQTVDRIHQIDPIRIGFDDRR